MKIDTPITQRIIGCFFVFFAAAFHPVAAQVTVSGSTGANATYTTLKAAFDALNANTNQSGNSITVTITASTTETASASLTGQAATPWTSLVIYPTVSGLSISGGSNSIVDLIVLNGADNVTFDGRVNQSGAKDLVITNSYNNIYNLVSTIKFIGDAQNNTVKYCTVKGSNNYYQPTGSGVIFFSTGTTSGNTGNTIDHCDLTGDATGGVPRALVYSFGTASKENTVTLTNNNFYNFSEYAIFTAAYSKSFVISDNSFYQTVTLTSTTGTTVMNLSGSGNGHQITGNFIGGSAAGCTGTWTANSAGNNSFVGIFLSSGVTTAAEVNGNRIQNLNLTTTWTSGNPFIGIQVTAGNANVGTTSANYIGDATTTGSIVVSANGTGMPGSSGIMNNSTGTVNISNNKIGSVTVTNTTVTGLSGHSFYGININNGTNTITNNTIGSTTTASSINLSNANSSSLSTGNGQYFFGIYCTSNFLSTAVNSNIIANITNAWSVTASGTNTGLSYGIYMSGSNASATALSISSNQIYNISSAMGSAAGTYNIYGIFATPGNVANILTIDNNQINNLTNTNASFAGQIVGIYNAGQANAGTITRNFIHSLTATGASSTAGLIYGVYIARGTTTYSNNIIRLGGDTKTTLYGFYETYAAASDAPKYYFNTVYIDGTLVSGATNKSYCYYSAFNLTARDIRNNLFINARSTTSGSNLHYAVYFSYTTPGTLTMSNNNYYTPGTGGVIGYYNNANKTSLPVITGYDANSLVYNPSFASEGGTTAANYIPANIVLLGTSGTGVTTDYTGTATRSASIPAMGAYEITIVPPVVVSATAGTASGNYATVKYAFDAINAGTHQGDINVVLNAGTNEFISASLNASSSPSSYTSVKLYPSVTGLTITGSIAAPLIDLNGADNVTIDGRVNQTGSIKDLVIVNTSALSTAGTSTIRFINDATTNTVKYCTLKGSTGDGSAGILFFSTTTGTTGSDGNAITNNNITNAADASRPRFSIFSSGTSAKENSGNTISNNYVYDLMARNANSSIIYLGDYNNAWTISGNSFYETAAFSTTAGVSHTVINVTYTNYAGTGYAINDNYIGGSAPLCAGTAWTKSDGQGNTFTGIYLKAGTGTYSDIQHNVIQNISYTNSTANVYLYGIRIAGGDVNVGSVSGNQIGEATGNNSIVNTTSLTGASGSVIAISLETTGNVNCLNNVIGALTYAHTLNNGSGVVTGISNSGSGGTKVISKNRIGSTDAGTTNSFYASSYPTSGSQTVTGIYNSSTGAVTIDSNVIAKLTNLSASTAGGTTRGIDVYSGTFTITNNTVYDLSLSAGTTVTAAVAGIYISSSSAVHTVTGNTVYNLAASHASYAGQVTGIYLNGSTGTASAVHRNFVYGVSVTGGAGSTAASLYGLYAYGSVNVANNIISLGGNSTSAVYGIYTTGSAAGSTESIYFNTIYIAGSLSSGATNKSYAFYNAAAGSTRDYRNNVLVNARSTVAGSNLHYALYINTTGGAITSNYNDYIASGTGGTIGYYGGNKTTSVIVTGQDANSANINPVFANAGGTTAVSYFLSASLPAASGTGITTDFSGSARDLTIPRMGAWEFNRLLPVVLVSFTGYSTATGNELNWITATETGNNSFELQRSYNGREFSTIITIAGKGNEAAGERYQYTDRTAIKGISYYRLKQREEAGQFTYSPVIRVGAVVSGQQLKVYPNPVTDGSVYLDLAAPSLVRIYNNTGILVYTGSAAAGHQQLTLKGLAAGVYTVVAGQEKSIIIIQ